MKTTCFAIALVLIGCSPQVQDPGGRNNQRGEIQSAGTGGAGGSGTVVSSVGVAGGTQGTGGAGGTLTCENAKPVGDLDDVGCDHNPGEGYCGNATLCDKAGNDFTVECTSEGCSCLYNAKEVCACTFDQPACSDSDSHEDCCVKLNSTGCCPYPWIQFPGCKKVDAACTMNAECCNYLCYDGHCQP